MLQAAMYLQNNSFNMDQLTRLSENMQGIQPKPGTSLHALTQLSQLHLANKQNQQAQQILEQVTPDQTADHETEEAVDVEKIDKPASDSEITKKLQESVRSRTFSIESIMNGGGGGSSSSISTSSLSPVVISANNNTNVVVPTFENPGSSTTHGGNSSSGCSPAQSSSITNNLSSQFNFNPMLLYYQALASSMSNQKSTNGSGANLTGSPTAQLTNSNVSPTIPTEKLEK